MSKVVSKCHMFKDKNNYYNQGKPDLFKRACNLLNNGSMARHGTSWPSLDQERSAQC